MAAACPSSKADSDHQAPQSTAQDRPQLEAGRLPLPRLQTRDLANRVEDGAGSEQPGHHREQHRPTGADEDDQEEGQQRAGDGAQVVHRALEAVGAPVGRRLGHVREQSIARRHPQPSRGPGCDPKQGRLPDRACEADQGSQHGRPDVAAGGHAPASLRVVGQSSAEEAGTAGGPVCETFDEAERSGRSAQGCRQEAGQDRRGDFVAGVCQEAGQADPKNAGRKPGALGLSSVRVHPSDFHRAQERALLAAFTACWSALR